MSNAIVTVDRVKVRRSFTPGYRPGKGGSRPLDEGEEFINFADGIRLIGDGTSPPAALPAYPLRPGIDDVPGLPDALSEKAGTGENADITKLAGLTDLGAIPGLPLILDSKTRTITDRLLDLARRSISAENFGAMGGQDDTAAWNALVAEASTRARPVMAGAYTSAMNGPAIIKRGGVKIWSEGGAKFVEKTGLRPCFTVGDPADANNQVTGVGFHGMFGDIDFSYVGARANKQSVPNINPYPGWSGMGGYHAAIFNAYSRDLTIEGVSITNFDQPLSLHGDVFTAQRRSKDLRIRRVRMRNYMFGIYATLWENAYLHDIEGHDVDYTTGPAGALFPPHTVYFGFSNAENLPELPSLNVQCSDLREFGNKGAAAFKFRNVRGLLVSGALSDGSVGLLDLSVTRQFNISGLVFRNPVQEVTNGIFVLKPVDVAGCRDGVIDLGSVAGDQEYSGPVSLGVYPTNQAKKNPDGSPINPWNLPTENVQLKGLNVRFNHATASASGRIPVLLKGTVNVTVDRPNFHYDTDVAQYPIRLEKSNNIGTDEVPQYLGNIGAKIIMPSMYSPAGTGTSRIVQIADDSSQGTVIIAASSLLNNGRKSDSISDAGIGTSVTWLDRLDRLRVNQGASGFTWAPLASDFDIKESATDYISHIVATGTGQYAFSSPTARATGGISYNFGTNVMSFRRNGGNALDLGAGFARVYGELRQSLVASTTPDVNGQMRSDLPNDTTLRFRVRGSDGVVRSASLTLA